MDEKTTGSEARGAGSGLSDEDRTLVGDLLKSLKWALGHVPPCHKADATCENSNYGSAVSAVRRAEAALEDEERRPVTVLDVARARLASNGVEVGDSVKISDILSVGLHAFGGCARCEASLAAYNAHPSRTGYWMCGDCIGGDGFETVGDFEEFLAMQDEGDPTL